MCHSSCARRCLGIAVHALAFAYTTIAQAQSPPFTWIGSVQYATGEYIFTQRTWSLYISNGVAWNSGRLRVTASLPVVVQDAGWVQYGGGGMMLPTGGITNGASGGSAGMMGGSMHGNSNEPSSNMPFSNLGIGDPIGRVEYDVVSVDGSYTRVSIVGSAKAPLANVNHGFGTGKWDAGAGISGRTVRGAMMFFGDAMYWSLGNPLGASLRNVVAYNVAVGRQLASDRWSVLATVSGATSYWPGLDAPVQAGFGIGHLLKSGTHVSVLGAVGLTRTAPSLSVGLGWRVPLGKVP